MQLQLSMKLASPLTLPMNYNHIQQAAIYNLLSGEEGLSDFVHDWGYVYGSRSFKMFCFSPLKGAYTIKDKRITFSNSISFEIRSNNGIFILKMIEKLKDDGIRLGFADIEKLDVNITDKIIRSDTAKIRMKSPVTVFSSDKENSDKTYRNPQEEVFYSLIEDNFVRKYTAYFGTYPAAKISIYPDDDTDLKKIVTYYHRAPIVGWYGDFVLEGDPGYINFLYNSGLGSKNAQGFGLFDVIA